MGRMITNIGRMSKGRQSGVWCFLEIISGGMEESDLGRDVTAVYVMEHRAP